jgi:hypothetical protein
MFTIDSLGSLRTALLDIKRGRSMLINMISPVGTSVFQVTITVIDPTRSAIISVGEDERPTDAIQKAIEDLVQKGA